MTSWTHSDATNGATEYGLAILMVATGAALAASTVATQLGAIWTVALSVLQRVAGA